MKENGKEMTMNATASEMKDVVRLQFDVRRAQLNIIDRLVDICGLSSKKELFSNSMALMKWAVQETQKGRRIASYDPEKDEIEVVALPALDLVQTANDGANNVTLREVKTATNRQTSNRKTKFGVV